MVPGAIAVVADAHLGGPGGAVGPLLEQLQEAAEQGMDRLVLLGDIFQAWVGLPAFDTDATRSFVATLTALRARGVWIAYVEGNRDFYLSLERYGSALDVLASEVAVDVGARRILFVHGDGLNDRDLQYRTWRRLSKSAPVRWLVSGLPASLARRFVDRTERQLARTNFKHKRQLPEAAIRAYAERRLGQGHELLVLGHFHEPRSWAVGGGEVRVLDAWFRSRRVEWIS